MAADVSKYRGIERLLSQPITVLRATASVGSLPRCRAKQTRHGVEEAHLRCSDEDKTEEPSPLNKMAQDVPLTLRYATTALSPAALAFRFASSLALAAAARSGGRRPAAPIAPPRVAVLRFRRPALGAVVRGMAKVP